jgi:hypothetical protein
MKLITAVLWFTALLSAQTPIRDVSVAGSPLFFASAMTADKYWANNVTAQNVSTKEILAYVIEYNGNFGDQHDLYFGRGGFTPGATQVITEWPSDTPKLPDTLQAKVLYVQFVDGTEWGDHSAGEKLLQSRQGSLQFMSNLIAAYNKGGEAAFMTLLNQTHENSTDMVWGMSVHFLKMKTEMGMAGVLQHIQMKLASAAKHDKTLNP